MTTQPFNPTPEIVPRILDDLASPNCSLCEIAEAYETSIDGLTLWLTRPDIAERFAAAESFAARRVRHVAACQLSAAVRTATNILDLFNNAAERRQLDEFILATQNVPANTAAYLKNGLPPQIAAMELRRRACETARKAASLLTRLARFEHGPPRPRPTPSTDHAAPTSEPQHTPKPAPPPESNPLPAIPTRAAADTRLHPIPTAAPTPQPAPTTASPLCDLRASARNSSEDPASPAGSPNGALAQPDSASHSAEPSADLLRRAEEYAQSIEAPDPSEEEIDALVNALETGDTAGLPPEIVERFESLKARGRLPTAEELLASFMPCDTS